MPAPTTITRHAGPLRFEGVRARSLSDLRVLVQSWGAPPLWAAADLSLGAWRGHQAATELAAQVGAELPAPRLLPRKVGAASEVQSFLRWAAGQGPPPSPDAQPYGDRIGQWIDHEARGDRATLGALERACRIVAAMAAGPPCTVLLFVPAFCREWEAEDRHLVGFLAHGLGNGPHRLLLVEGRGEASPLPAGWDVDWRDAQAPGDVIPVPEEPEPFALVPGLLDPQLVEALGAPASALQPLAGGRFLVPPELRGPPAPSARLAYDRLASASGDVPWLRAHAQCHGNNLYVDPWFLCAEAHHRMDEGGHGIALRLIERAIACSRNPEQRATLQSIAQGWRIALQRYEEATALADPSPALPPVLRASLLQTKGWGFVMLNQPHRAEPYMRAALELLEEPLRGRREYLYLMNISALNWVNLGDLDRPLAVERQIEASAAALEGGERDYRLEYVNAINIARLHRRRGELEDAASYYTRAFSTTLGARSESDAVYTNVCWARLNADRGRTLEAFQGWLRAGLHWSACTAPEALGWRPLSAILGRRVKPGEVPTEEVFSALTRATLDAARAAGLAELAAAAQVPGDAPAPVFLRADRLPEGVEAGFSMALGAAGWGVVLSRAAARPAFEGPATRTLAWALWTFLRRLAGSEGASPGCVVVDDRLGREIPQTLSELVEVCLRRRVSCARFDGVDVRLDEPVRARLREACRVRVGSAVRGVETGAVEFKRYLPRRVLSAAESVFLRSLEGDPPLSEARSRLAGLGDPTEFDSMLGGLEAARVVEVCLPPEALTQRSPRSGADAGMAAFPAATTRAALGARTSSKDP